MKAIELTEEHKSKLLEMCKVLFPEYNVSWIDFKFDDSDLIWFRKDDPYECKGIHWFEFVMGELTNKLYKLFYNAMGEQNILWDLLVKEGFYVQVLHHKTLHPVDYLYENFKKLKL